MEIQFLHERAIEEDPKLMINCIQKMVSGETPFFPTTLSLVYDKLVEKAFTTRSLFDRYPSGRTKGQSPIRPVHSPRASRSTPNINTFLTVGPAASSSSLQARAPTYEPEPLTTTTQSARLRCIRCYEVAPLQDLHEGLRCPRCPEIVWWTMGWKRPIMQCTSCNLLRVENSGHCYRIKCGRRFV